MNDKQEARLTELEDKAARNPKEEREFNALEVLEAQAEKLEEAKTSGEGVEEAQAAFDAALKAVEDAEKAV